MTHNNQTALVFLAKTALCWHLVNAVPIRHLATAVHPLFLVKIARATLYLVTKEVLLALAKHSRLTLLILAI